MSWLNVVLRRVAVCWAPSDRSTVFVLRSHAWMESVHCMALQLLAGQSKPS